MAAEAAAEPAHPRCRRVRVKTKKKIKINTAKVTVGDKQEDVRGLRSQTCADVRADERKLHASSVG